MPLFYVGVQFRLVTGTQNFNEIVEVVLISGSSGIRRISGVFSVHGWPRFVFPAEISFPIGAIEMHPSFCSVKEIAYLNFVFAVGVQSAHFKLNAFAVAIFQRGVLHVGGFLIVIESKLPAPAKNLLGILRFVQAPARDIHLMRSLITQIGAAVVPEPMPIVVKAIFVEGPERRWSKPQIVMHTCGRGAVCLMANGVSRLEANALGHINLADTSV